MVALVRLQSHSWAQIRLRSGLCRIVQGILGRVPAGVSLDPTGRFRRFKVPWAGRIGPKGDRKSISAC